MNAPNVALATHVRAISFSLTLSEEAINDLLFMRHAEQDCIEHGKDPHDYPATYYGRAGLCGYLARRGLISSGPEGGWSLTKAGSLMADILTEAGFVGTHHKGTMFPASFHDTRP